MRKLEVLAPAGSYESIIAAVNAGADAVYTGGRRFGARAYADNAAEDMLLKGLDYAHHFGVKLYMTVNTVLKNNEIRELESYLSPYYYAGIDAAIVQDLGVFSLLKSRFPDLDLHISTQMNISGDLGAKLLHEMGASRVVLARELSLEEIRMVDKSSDIEIECFVHGALCYAYSGQCLMSSLIGGRSGNRGRCAQTCRLNYDLYQKEGGCAKKLNREKERSLLSCKDLCSLDILPDIAEAGADSLKIEGRMKSPRYTAGVVSIWRKYADLYEREGREGYRVEESDRRLLLELFDRGGQTEGYYRRHNGREMIALSQKPSFRRADEEYFRYLDETYVNTTKKLPIYGSIRIRSGERIRLHVETEPLSDLPQKEAKVYADMPDAAKSRAASEEEIRKQILKTGNTLYEFSHLEIDLEEGLFVPNKALNELRREGLSRLEEEILSAYRRKEKKKGSGESREKAEPIAPGKPEKNSYSPALHVVCEEKSQLDAVLAFCRKNPHIFAISFEADTIEPKQWEDYVRRIHGHGIRANLYLPHIFRREALSYFGKYEGELKQADFDGFLIRCVEEIAYLNTVFSDSFSKPEYLFDYSLYSLNREAGEVFAGLGASRLTLPLELNLKELGELGCEGKEMIAYGRIPMMVSAQCLRKNTLGCDKKYSTLSLKDRYQNEMPVKNRCHFCYNTIYNAKPLSVLGIGDRILDLRPAVLRIWLSTEDQKGIARILTAYIKRFKFLEKTEEISEDFTRAHLKRGVE
ncbi:MAG: DUF3656 domain-containing protein [Johnsonella sp.]|nr:DUF3656 domain-containing protein [Johnsonella sp.]